MPRDGSDGSGCTPTEAGCPRMRVHNAVRHCHRGAVTRVIFRAWAAPSRHACEGPVEGVVEAAPSKTGPLWFVLSRRSRCGVGGSSRRSAPRSAFLFVDDAHELVVEV